MTQPVKQQPQVEKHEKKEYRIHVDGKPLSSDQPVLTGAQIKALAQVDPSFGLFLEGRGNHPDQHILDSHSVDLREPGREHFYTVPPATFGDGR